MSIPITEKVKAKYDGYPEAARTSLLAIRNLIYRVAEQDKLTDIVGLAGLNQIDETLKWGEPSYVSKMGSPIRLGWSAKRAEQCGIYLNCNTKLVETFRELYGDIFSFEGNRAIIFKIDQLSSLFNHEKELSYCISLALRYRQIKHLPMLGA